MVNIAQVDISSFKLWVLYAPYKASLCELSERCTKNNKKTCVRFSEMANKTANKNQIQGIVKWEFVRPATKRLGRIAIFSSRK